jgi:hypothetical protein
MYSGEPDDGAVAGQLGVAAHALDQPEVEDLDAAVRDPASGSRA